MASTKKKTKKKNINTKNSTKKKNTNVLNTKSKSEVNKKINKIELTNKETIKIKKSNYKRIQGKVLEDNKNKIEQEKSKKVVKQNKQVARNIKKEKEQKDKKFFRKVYLIILSVVIKTKYFFAKLFQNIKKCIIKFGLFIKKIFINLRDIKIKDTGKKKKIKKTKEIVLESKISEKNKNKFQLFKRKKNKTIEDKKNNKDRKVKPLRSLTGRVLPSTFLKADRKIRKNIYIKEALIFMIIITIIDFIGFYKTNYIDMLHVFDNSLWNIIITITFTMLVTLLGVYIIDYLVTEITLRIRKMR